MTEKIAQRIGSAVLVAALASPAWAGSAGASTGFNWPWVQAIEAISDTVIGPVAIAAAGAFMVFAFMAMRTGDGESAMKKGVGAVVFAAIGLGADVVVGNLQTLVGAVL